MVLLSLSSVPSLRQYIREDWRDSPLDSAVGNGLMNWFILAVVEMYMYS